MILALGERGGDLLDRLEEASAETTRAVLDASERLTTSLNFKTGHVHDEFVDLADRVHEMLNERIDRITGEFEQRSSAIVDGISDRTEQVHDSLKNSGRSRCCSSSSCAATTWSARSTTPATASPARS